MTALTVTNATLVNSATHRQIYVTVSVPSTPTQASNTIVYDPTGANYSGAYVATKIRGIRAVSTCQGASGTQGAIQLNWDASTPVVAMSIPINGQLHYDSAGSGDFYTPLPNQGGSGVSGKIGMTTVGLVAGDSFAFVLDIING